MAIADDQTRKLRDFSSFVVRWRWKFHEETSAATIDLDIVKAVEENQLAVATLVSQKLAVKLASQKMAITHVSQKMTTSRYLVKA